MGKMRVGIVGSGFWATRHGEALRNSTTAELVAVGGGPEAPGYAERFGLRRFGEGALQRTPMNADSNGF